MANKNSNLTFVRCPSCNSLVPALSTRCRMCGATIELNNDSTANSQSNDTQAKGSRVRQKTMTISESMKEAIMEDLGANDAKNKKAQIDTQNPLAQDENDDASNAFLNQNNYEIDSNDPLASFIENQEINEDVTNEIKEEVTHETNDDMDDIFENLSNHDEDTISIDDKQVDKSANQYDELSQEYADDDFNNDIDSELKEDTNDDFQENESHDIENNINEKHDENADEDDLFSNLGDDIFSQDLDLNSILEDANSESEEPINIDDLFDDDNNDDILEEDDFGNDNLANDDLEDDTLEDDTLSKDESVNENLASENLEEESYKEPNLNAYDLEENDEDNIYTQISKQQQFKEDDEEISNDNTFDNDEISQTNDDDFLKVEHVDKPQDFNLEDLANEILNETPKSNENISHKSQNHDYDDEFKSVDEILTKDDSIKLSETNDEEKQTTTQEISVDPKIKETYDKQKLVFTSSQKKNNIKLNFGSKEKQNENVNKNEEIKAKEFDTQTKENDEENKEKIEIKVEKIQKDRSTIIPEISKLSLSDLDVKKDLKGRLFGWLVSFRNQSGKAFELREGKFFITKSSLKENDLIINDDSISTPHALMTVSKNNGLILQDLMSETGIFLKHKKDEEYEKQEAPFKVTHGDWVKFGNVEYLVSLIAYVGE